ncbi:MAG: M14 family zinc carboxypeptidase [Bacteroidota bacterium]
MRTLSSIIIFILLSTGCTQTSQKEKHYKGIVPPIIEADFQKLTSHENILKYLEKVDSLSERLSVEYVGTSVDGKKIPLVKFSKDGKFNNSKVKLFMFAQQHGNEPSGKEGMLLLIDKLLQKEYDKWLKKVDLLIMPQVNPDGGDRNQRRNTNDADLNRDHLVLSQPETQALHRVFERYQPEMTVDIHEYYPFSSRWKEFGYLKDFDIQIGGLTNLNIDTEVTNFFYEAVKPFMKEKLNNEGYSFFEYTLGNFPDGKRLRHSTVDINDGRQSFGILNTSSFIVEGIRGKDSLDNIERRTKSQYVTAEGFIEVAAKNRNKIKHKVHDAREELIQHDGGDKVSIRMKHVKGDKPLEYPLKSIKTGEDTVFVVDNYHSERESSLDIEKPSAYLIPAADSNLIKWLDRSFVQYTKYIPSEDHCLHEYKLLNKQKTIDEELENYNVDVKLQKSDKKIKNGEYLMIPTAQLRSNKIIIALEPQSMTGLVNYPEFEYLIKDFNTYPILRLDKQ